MSQGEMSLCSRRDYEKADAEMTLAYKQLLLELPI